MFDIQKNQDLNYSNAHLLYRLPNEYEELFICFVKFWSQPPVSLDCSRGTKFHYAAFNSS